MRAVFSKSVCRTALLRFSSAGLNPVHLASLSGRSLHTASRTVVDCNAKFYGIPLRRHRNMHSRFSTAGASVTAGGSNDASTASLHQSQTVPDFKNVTICFGSQTGTAKVHTWLQCSLRHMTPVSIRTCFAGLLACISKVM